MTERQWWDLRRDRGEIDEESLDLVELANELMPTAPVEADDDVHPHWDPRVWGR